MSKFAKYFAKALDVQHDIMGDLAVITVKGKQLNQPISVVINEDFGVVNDIQNMFTVICIKKSDMPNIPPSGTTIEVNSKKYIVDDLFVGANFESDEYEWCVAVRET